MVVAPGIQHLIYPASLPPLLPGPAGAGVALQSLSVLSYNVMLPNSSDGWWIYKMYNNNNPVVPPAAASASTSSPEEMLSRIVDWDHRRDLLRDRIGTIGASLGARWGNISSGDPAPVWQI